MQKLTKIFLIFVFAILLFLLLFKKERIIIIDKDIEQIEHLDIILTSGQSVQSKMLNLINFSFESYSHIGIICKKKNSVFVLHSTTDGTKENGIRFDDLQSFLDLSNVNYYKILRNDSISKSILSLNKSIERYKTNEIPFDYDFDNQNKDRIYCSELVYDIFSSNGILSTKLDLDKPIHPKTFTKLNELKTVITRKSTANRSNMFNTN